MAVSHTSWTLVMYCVKINQYTGNNTSCAPRNASQTVTVWKKKFLHFCCVWHCITHNKKQNTLHAGLLQQTCIYILCGWTTIDECNICIWDTAYDRDCLGAHRDLPMRSWRKLLGKRWLCSPCCYSVIMINNSYGFEQHLVCIYNAPNAELLGLKRVITSQEINTAHRIWHLEAPNSNHCVKTTILTQDS